MTRNKNLLPSYQTNELPPSYYQSVMDTSDFQEQSVRLSFIKKVYSALMLQLIYTAVFCAIFIKVDSVKNYVASHSSAFLWSSFAIMIVVELALVCSERLRKSFPLNAILLGIFTTGMALMMGMVTASYNTEMVLVAAIMTIGVFLVLKLVAFQTKYDFTSWGGALLAFLVILIIFSFANIFIKNQVVNLVYASLGAIIFCFYILYDTQLMMGGNHKYSIAPDEIVLAAMSLYLDIVNLFLFILQLLDIGRN
jgi:protein lifeguard